jgi:pectinesterase
MSAVLVRSARAGNELAGAAGGQLVRQQGMIARSPGRAQGGLVIERVGWFVLGVLAAASAPAGAQTRVQVRSDLDLARPEEVVEIPAAALAALAKPSDLAKVRVADDAGRELLAQAVDLDGDASPDQLVFLADFAPQQSRTFVLTLGERRVWKKEDFRVYGRFVRERHDDFAWENDRVAHRVYGQDLETWDQEPLTGSGVDVWCKRTRRLVLNDWYMTDAYHEDHGEGADFYSAGRTRGCGGSGIWRDGRLWVSRNFRGSRVLAAGPLRLVFELDYEPFDTGGASVAETKRVVVDAGRNLHRFESRYRPYRRPGQGEPEITWAAGIKKHAAGAVRFDKAEGTLRTWEPIEKNGNMGCAVVIEPARLLETAEADGNALAVARTATGQPAVYYAGFGWDRSGDFADQAAWDRYVSEFARRLGSPLRVEVQRR